MIDRDVVVVGGGIGGLTVACALLSRGARVQVWERAPAIQEVGAGVMISPNAMRLLNQLGLEAELRAVSVPLTWGEMASWTGEALGGLPLDELSRLYGAECMVFHRAALQGVLHRRFLELAGEDQLHLGATFLSQAVEGDRVVARFSDGREARGDVLIGADGLRSAVRGSLFGEIPIRYSGQSCWRGITRSFEHEKMPVGTLRETQGPSARFGACHVDRDRVYWWAAVDRPEGEPQGPCSPEDYEQILLPAYAGWGPPVVELLEATSPSEIVRNDLVDILPLPAWHEGPVVLLGDAAHAMTPNLGQGACSAIEDAWVLAAKLDRHPELETALAAYREERFERTRYLQAQSWRFGRIGQWKRPWACRIREVLLRLTPLSVIRRSWETLYRWSPSDLEIPGPAA